MKKTAPPSGRRAARVLKQTPSQTVGPYFAYGLVPTQYGYGTGHSFPSLFDERIAGEGAKGQQILVLGRLFDGAGMPIPDAMIEVLQADADGRYETRRDVAARSGFRGFGRTGTGTDPTFLFRFETVKPGATQDGQAPHLNVIVLMRGLLVHAFTRIYFEDEAEANAADPVLQSVPAKRRPTLLAKREAEQGGRTVYRFDIRMQGADETVFFDV